MAGSLSPGADRCCIASGLDRGHPYLTQRLCRAVAEAAKDRRWWVGGEELVDQLCTELFLSSHAQERDHNLIFVRERLLRAETEAARPAGSIRPHPQRESRAGRSRQSTRSLLRLAGIIRVSQGLLDVRNRIYRQVFNRTWVTTNLPGAEFADSAMLSWRTVSRAALVAFGLVVTVSLVTLHRHTERRRQVFDGPPNPRHAYQEIRSYQDNADLQLQMRMDGAALDGQRCFHLCFARSNRSNLSLKLRFGLMETDVRSSVYGQFAGSTSSMPTKSSFIPGATALGPLAEPTGWAISSPPASARTVWSKARIRASTPGIGRSANGIARREMVDDPAW